MGHHLGEMKLNKKEVSMTGYISRREAHKKSSLNNKIFDK